jgi:hypothetical protein
LFKAVIDNENCYHVTHDDDIFLKYVMVERGVLACGGAPTPFHARHIIRYMLMFMKWEDFNRAERLRTRLVSIMKACPRSLLSTFPLRTLSGEIMAITVESTCAIELAKCDTAMRKLKLLSELDTLITKKSFDNSKYVNDMLAENITVPFMDPLSDKIAIESDDAPYTKCEYCKDLVRFVKRTALISEYGYPHAEYLCSTCDSVVRADEGEYSDTLSFHQSDDCDSFTANEYFTMYEQDVTIISDSDTSVFDYYSDSSFYVSSDEEALTPQISN